MEAGMTAGRALPDLLDDYYVARHSNDPKRRGETFDAIAALVTNAPNVWDGTLPPGGFVCGACGQPVESEPCEQHQSARFLDLASPEADQRLADALQEIDGWCLGKRDMPAAIERVLRALRGEA
jgi:hypothetical protein